MQQFNAFLEVAVGYLWSLPMVYLLVGTGILLTVLLKGVQFRGFLHALHISSGRFAQPDAPGQITHFQALCTALSGTIGIGNISGIAAAIHAGGPGATFWMVICGLVGMVTKYAECTLSVMYREVDENGFVRGGPMHYIVMGLGKKARPLAAIFALACALVALGAGNIFQANQVAAIFNSNFSVPQYLTGIALNVLVALVILGGITRIARVTSYLVPLMAALFVLGSLLALALNLHLLPQVFSTIVNDAFHGTAFVGGLTGIAVKEVITQGVRRACFSNEAGMGSSPIAHAAAKTREPVREGLVGSLEPFIDTVVLGTLTAVVISLSGEWSGKLNGVELAARAYDSAIPGFGHYFIPLAAFLFAYATMLSWSYYGEQAVGFLIGRQQILPYKFLYCLLPLVGALGKMEPILNLCDALLVFMVLPNMIALWFLFPQIRRATNIYFQKLQKGDFATR